MLALEEVRTTTQYGKRQIKTGVSQPQEGEGPRKISELVHILKNTDSDSSNPVREFVSYICEFPRSRLVVIELGPSTTA